MVSRFANEVKLFLTVWSLLSVVRTRGKINLPMRGIVISAFLWESPIYNTKLFRQLKKWLPLYKANQSPSQKQNFFSLSSG